MSKVVKLTGTRIIRGETAGKMYKRVVPRNGICLKSGKLPITVVAKIVLSRNMTKIICGDPNKTYAFPGSATTICPFAFSEVKHRETPVFIKLNEGLEILENSCFANSRIARLTLPASVKSIGKRAFYVCRYLQRVDFSAARGLKTLGK